MLERLFFVQAMTVLNVENLGVEQSARGRQGTFVGMKSIVHM